MLLTIKDSLGLSVGVKSRQIYAQLMRLFFDRLLHHFLVDGLLGVFLAAAIRIRVLPEDELTGQAFCNCLTLVVEYAISFLKRCGSERRIARRGNVFMTGAALQSKAELSVLTLMFAHRLDYFSDTLLEHLFFLFLFLFGLGPDLV